MAIQKVLLIYSTTDGRSLEIMTRIAKQLEPLAYDLVNIKAVDCVHLDTYEAILIGASIRYGRFDKAVFKFVEKHLPLLATKKTAFFGVCVTARKLNKNTPETNRYIIKFFDQIAWRPDLKAVFAGALFYPNYNFLDKTMIRFIMWMGGEKNHKMTESYSYTDWDKVDSFAKQFMELIVLPEIG